MVEKPFIFVHINKTGGSSIERALGLELEHKTAREYIADLGEGVWEKQHTFSVVRNPWDKVVSHYHWRVKTNQTALAESPIDFCEWVKRAFGNNEPGYYDKPKMFMPSEQWLINNKGEIAVNTIMRFENLINDFDALCRQLGVVATLPHLKKTERTHYQQYYNDEACSIIALWFKNDIEQFNYQF
ncbi:MAG: hypothetical protein ACJA0N_000064 [Pseudohongiellaceae bacterium]|jgi:hypothetical protein